MAKSSEISVLFASPTAEMGGAEQVILALARSLPEKGIRASLALLRPGPLEEVAKKQGIPVHVFPDTYRYRDLISVSRCVRWLTGLLRAEKFSLLHSNLTAHYIGGWAARLAGVPELWHMHDYPSRFDPVHAISRRIPTNFLLFTTRHIQSGEPRLRHIPSAIVHPNCVDATRLRSAAKDFSILSRLKLERERYFLTVTRLQPHKGHKYLIEAAAELAGEAPEMKWVISGKAKGEEQERYLRGLGEQIAARGLEGRVLFTGFLADEELAALFEGATALVHPALSEGYGLVLLEAMALGTPVVAAAAAGPAEIITDGENGLLVPVEDGGALAKAMRRLLSDKKLKEHLRARGSAYAEEQSVEMMTAETLAAYRQTLATARVGAGSD